MKILEPFQEINYTVKYAVLPSNSIENTMRPSEELIKEQNNGSQLRAHRLAVVLAISRINS